MVLFVIVLVTNLCYNIFTKDIIMFKEKFVYYFAGFYLSLRIDNETGF